MKKSGQKWKTKYFLPFPPYLISKGSKSPWSFFTGIATESKHIFIIF
jgi:hypothetical protein